MPERVYVPNSDAGTLDVIDPRRLRVVGRFTVGAMPHHVTPSWDLKELYVTNTVGNSLTVLDPRRSKPAKTIPVDDPYNLYFTPDGSKAIVVAERLQRLDVRDPRNWKLRRGIRVPWSGVDQLDFSADGRARSRRASSAAWWRRWISTACGWPARRAWAGCPST
ncbi:MAG: YncE family protein [Thermoleophilaceae bacterium]|nr:YncE family protein [Thermoleophilaceae bacterium]